MNFNLLRTFTQNYHTCFPENWRLSGAIILIIYLKNVYCETVLICAILVTQTITWGHVAIYQKFRENKITKTNNSPVDILFRRIVTQTKSQNLRPPFFQDFHGNQKVVYIDFLGPLGTHRVYHRYNIFIVLGILFYTAIASIFKTISSTP